MRIWPVLVLVGCGEPIRDFLHPELGPQTTTLFLNYEPTVFVNLGGEDASQSSSTLVTGQTMFPGYREGASDRAVSSKQLTDEIAGVLAPYAIRVTRQRPSEGPYHMIMFTDASGSVVDCDSCITRAPILCDGTADSATGFVFGGSGSSPFLFPHLTTSRVIAMVGSFAAIPLSSEPGDCMCTNTMECLEATLTTGCTIGGAATPIATTQDCPTSRTTMDEDAEFIAAFGLAP